MRKIFIATKNKGKIKEITYCFNGLGIEILSMQDKPDIPDIEETGKTFEENAWIKAKGFYEIVKMPVLADDSGLEVDYLNGAPGIYSSRYAGENATDDENCQKLLEELKNIDESKRTARFHCIAVYYDGKEKKIFDGLCEGQIIDHKRGNNGFGYDPLFVPQGFSQTYSELSDEVKNRISHRGKALQKFREYMLINFL